MAHKPSKTLEMWEAVNRIGGTVMVILDGRVQRIKGVVVESTRRGLACKIAEGSRVTRYTRFL